MKGDFITQKWIWKKSNIYIHIHHNSSHKMSKLCRIVKCLKKWIVGLNLYLRWYKLAFKINENVLSALTPVTSPCLLSYASSRRLQWSKRFIHKYISFYGTIPETSFEIFTPLLNSTQRKWCHCRETRMGCKMIDEY